MGPDAAVRQALRALLGPTAGSLPGSAALADHGLTSVQAIELVYGLEETLGVELGDDQLTRDAFRSIDSLRAVFEAAQQAS